MELNGPKSTIQRARTLRRTMTLPEILLWQMLRKRPARLKFRKQHPAGPYVLDFYGDAVRMAVEVDGEVHGRGDQPERDVARDAWLLARHVSVVRVPAAAAVLSDLEGVVRHIVANARGAAPSTTR